MLGEKKKKVLLLDAQGDKIPSEPIIPISPSFLPNSISKTKKGKSYRHTQKNGQPVKAERGKLTGILIFFFLLKKMILTYFNVCKSLDTEINPIF